MKKEAMLYEKVAGKKAACRLCCHRCIISDGESGICGVRMNENGTLYTFVHGEAIAAHVDPIEKKPFYHLLPGSFSFSIATVGCNFKCGFCQNWQISQASARSGNPGASQLPPPAVVAHARKQACKSISYTYTEPTIFFEYAYDTARLAKQKGLLNTFVTNGYMTAEALEAIAPYLDAANVDLKSFRDDFYAQACHARLQPVLDSIAMMRQRGIWVEVTTLIIPGENDSDEELNAIARFIAGIDKNIPWHISRFHPDYHYTNGRATPVSTLKRAVDIGKKQGLRYLYPGNVAEDSNTYCYRCGAVVVELSYMSTEHCRVKNNACQSCGTPIAGRWQLY